MRTGETHAQGDLSIGLVLQTTPLPLNTSLRAIMYLSVLMLITSVFIFG